MVAHGLSDLQTVAARALKAGLDMDMVGEAYLTTLEKSLEEGKISEKDIDQACRRVLEAKYKLGLFDDPYRYIDESRPANDILSDENRQFAREVAARSMVLLKNENQVLPLEKAGTIALIGPLANDKANMLGTWAPTGDRTLPVPVLEGFKNALQGNARVLYAKGANIVDNPEYAKKVNVFGERISIDKRSPEVMIDEAVSMANRSDIVVAVIGEASEMSGESANRTSLQIPESQKKLVRALDKTGKPLVLVTMSGRPLALVEEDSLADALLHAWHPGIEAGNAVADVIFGDYNPSGKLTMTFPRNVGQVPIYYSHRTTGRPQEGDEFQKFKSNYLDVPNSPLYRFGYGLSYTNFTYDEIALSAAEMTRDDTITVSVNVTNSGDKKGEEIVQLYIRDLVASVTRPVKELKGFRKVYLPPGETRQINFAITVEDLSFYHPDLQDHAEPGEFEVFVGGNTQDVLTEVFDLIE
jgi:beta-glucosidase